MFDTTNFLGGEIVKDNSVILVTENAANVYKIKSDEVKQKDVLITYVQNPNLTWSFSVEKQKLLCSTYEKNPKTRFNIVPINFYYKTYWITHKEKCLTYSSSKMYFELRDCNEKDKNQLFQLDNIGDIDFNEDNADLILSLANRKQFMINKIQLSHRLEYEGDNLIKNIYNMLKKIVYCLNEVEICTFDYNYFVKKYAEYSYSSSSSHMSNSSESANSAAKISSA
ncbi:hypothetical protein BDAP_001623 [Binucleata daphniae]